MEDWGFIVYLTGLISLFSMTLILSYYYRLATMADDLEECDPQQSPLEALDPDPLSLPLPPPAYHCEHNLIAGSPPYLADENKSVVTLSPPPDYTAPSVVIVHS
ncbi:hypothetical protein EDD86DRAFT_249332 [Gorgonomyces haynaldii]|nr:hypothetical protein EDD86DRAFT_249332 [Gorgonomyces haynaldii]